MKPPVEIVIIVIQKTSHLSTTPFDLVFLYDIFVAYIY